MSADHTHAMTLRITEVQHERLRSTSYLLRRPVSELIRDAIDRAHWHTAGVWCEECPPSRRLTAAADAGASDESAAGASGEGL